MRYSLVLVLFAAAGVSAAEPALILKTEKLAAPDAVAEPVRALLGPEAFVIRSDKNEVLLRLWFRGDVPGRATEQQVKNGLTYREIPAATVLGVVEFPHTFVDFRKQEIPAGTYTLRFALQPEIGDHLGVTPHREFVLLTPAAKDAKAEAIELKTLIEQSSETTNGTHPAVMMLFPSKVGQNGSKLTSRGANIPVLEFARPVTADGGKGSLGFAITVGGHAKE